MLLQRYSGAYRHFANSREYAGQSTKCILKKMGAALTSPDTIRRGLLLNDRRHDLCGQESGDAVNVPEIVAIAIKRGDPILYTESIHVWRHASHAIIG